MSVKSNTDKKTTKLTQKKQPWKKRKESQTKIKTGLKAGPEGTWP
jgi:hypothetical protein